MKTFSEKELIAKALFAEEAEKAKQVLFPIMQEIQKYIPNAEYGYRVQYGEYPQFYGIQIEFTLNDIRFHLHKIYKEDRYRIVADLEHFKNMDRNDIERIAKLYDKPCNIGKFTSKKVNDWINYYTSIYNQVAKEDAERVQKMTDFLKSIETETIRWEDAMHTKGQIIRNGLCFSFHIDKGFIFTNITLYSHGANDYQKFCLMADNQFPHKNNY